MSLSLNARSHDGLSLRILRGLAKVEWDGADCEIDAARRRSHDP
jgi:hypothetical protein